MTTTLQQHDSEQIAGVLVGHRVIEAVDDTLILDNGTRLRVIPNDGCGGCAAGNYTLNELHAFDNIITHVRVTDSEANRDRWDEARHIYTVFVYAGKKSRGHTLIAASGDDGNGYYGTGFELEVQEM